MILSTLALGSLLAASASDLRRTAMAKALLTDSAHHEIMFEHAPWSANPRDWQTPEKQLVLADLVLALKGKKSVTVYTKDTARDRSEISGVGIVSIGVRQGGVKIDTRFSFASALDPNYTNVFPSWIRDERAEQRARLKDTYREMFQELGRSASLLKLTNSTLHVILDIADSREWDVHYTLIELLNKVDAYMRTEHQTSKKREQHYVRPLVEHLDELRTMMPTDMSTIKGKTYGLIYNTVERQDCLWQPQ